MVLPQSRRSGISPFYVMEVMRAAEERAAAGGDVLHLEVGQPSTPAPAGVIEAAHAALDSDVLGYTTAAGLEALRRRIAEHYRSWYGAEVDPGRIIVTFGASGAFVLSFLAAFDAGDRVVVPSPDPAEGSRFARFSYAGATDDMVEAMRRLRGWTP